MSKCCQRDATGISKNHPYKSINALPDLPLQLANS